MDDLHHINKQITKDQVNADKKRLDAETARQRAYQYGDAGNDGQMAFYLAAAEKLDHEAREIDDKRTQAEHQLQSLEAQIADLEQQKERAIAEHDARLSEITKQIDRLRGTSLSL